MMWALAPEGRPFKLAHDFRLLKLQVGLRAHCYHYPVTDPAPTAIPRHLTTVFLDRDGVLNKKMPEPRYVASWADFHILPGVPDAIARLNRAGLRVIVLSNQRGIALGLYTAADVEAIHSAFQRILSSNGAHIDAFFICPHDRGQCNCRKPLPGLFHQATAQFPTIAAASSVMIGDSLVDIDFARRLGMTAILIDSNSEHARPGDESARALATLCFSSLPEAVSA
jgi:D-glycero-D-manno-heptose 1,7-bisphosphate phosphatase